jgi:ribosome-binding factor A
LRFKAFIPIYLRAMDSVRQNKVNSLLQHEMAEVMQGHNRVLLPGGLITVTTVRVSPDLGVAKVYLSLFPVKDKQAVLENVRNMGSRTLAWRAGPPRREATAHCAGAAFLHR